MSEMVEEARRIAISKAQWVGAEDAFHKGFEAGIVYGEAKNATQAYRVGHAVGIAQGQAKMDQLIVDVDSYFSLIVARHVRRDSIDSSLDLELQEVLGRLRTASKEAVARIRQRGEK